MHMDVAFISNICKISTNNDILSDRIFLLRRFFDVDQVRGS